MSRRHPRPALRALYLLVAGLAFPGPHAAAALTLMHGHATENTAIVWIMADAPGPVEVSWQPDANAPGQALRLEATAANGNIVVARLTGLIAGRATAYQVSGDGKRREGVVRAQPIRTTNAATPAFTLAIGSCYFLADADPPAKSRNYGEGFEIFDSVVAAKPDAMLWLGDNLYLQAPDFTDPLAMAVRYRRQRTHEPLQALLTATAHVATWDDHDYGSNNANRSFALKDESMALFKRYWPNPEFGQPGIPGIFGKVSYGDIEVFMLDDRWYRMPDRSPDGPRKAMFGAAQLDWLRGALLASNATVKLIAGGSQFLNRANRFEGWNHFADEQRDFLDFLHARRIEGVMFLSGDRHFTELLKIERPGGYPLYEFTSSPLTSRPWARPDKDERDNPDLVPGTLVGKRQFGLIHAFGTGDARRLALESRDTSGKLLWRRELRVRDLTYERH